MTLHLCWKQNVRRVAFLNNQRCFNGDVRRATTKYKHAQTAFEEAFNKEIEKKKSCLNLWMLIKILVIWVKNLNSIVNKLNNTKSSMIDTKPKDASKIYLVVLDKSETYSQEEMLPKDGLNRYLCQPDERHGDQNRRTTDFIWKKDTYKLDQIVKDPGNHALYYLHCGSDRTFVSEEIMHIPEQVSKRK